MMRLGRGARGRSTVSTTRLLALSLSALGALAGCAGPSRYFAGDPQAAPGHYWGPDPARRADLPLEDQFGAVPPSSVQVLDASPASAWRPLADIKIESTTAADALTALKDQAARFGADGVLRLASGVGAQRTTRSAESFSRYGASFDLPASELVETSYGVAGTAVRRATPGTEAYLGVACAGYSPTSVSGQTAAPAHLVPYLASATGPAAAGGLKAGDFVMAWTAEGSEDVLSADCAGLNASLQAAGPGKSVTFTLWRPEGSPQELVVRVPHPRIIGADINKNAEGKLRVDRLLQGSPAAVAGIQVGDFLVSVGGAPVDDEDKAIQLIRAGPAVQKLEVVRAGAKLAIEVRTAPLTSLSARDVPRLGVLVQWVYSAGTAAEGDLRPGDVLLDFPTARDFATALKAQGDEMKVRVRREGAPREATAKLEVLPDARYRMGAGLYDRAAAPALPSPAVESPRGCARDIECKGDRICVKGECTDPKPK